MVAITKLIMLGIAVVCVLTLAFIVFDFVEDKVRSKFSKKRNRVKFYVARDKNGDFYLYMGKPVRESSEFLPCHYGKLIKSSRHFSKYGLNDGDYAYLKWEDEPVEVFVNMED